MTVMMKTCLNILLVTLFMLCLIDPALAQSITIDVGGSGAQGGGHVDCQ